MMTPRLLATVIVGAGCVAAAGMGGYLAVRHNAAPEQVALAAPEPVAGSTPAVTETEAEISAEPAASAPVAAPTAKPAPVATAPVPATRRNPVSAPKVTVQATTPSRPAARPNDSGIAQNTPGPVAQEPVNDQRQPAAQRPYSAPAPAEAEPSPASSRQAEPPPPLGVPETVETPRRQYDEVVVPADAVVGVQIERSLSSETARIEDRVDARVTRDVRAAGQVAIPAGSQVRGSVVMVDRGGKFKERARLGIRFHTLVLADGTTVPMQTETVYREGEAPTGESAAKIGGSAIGGAILGAILGGGKGAVIGGATGAGAGTAAVMAGGRNAATLQAGSNVTVRLSSPVTLTVEQRDRSREDQ